MRKFEVNRFLKGNQPEMNYTQPIHEVSAEGTEFSQSLTPREYQLHMLAQKMLGSSYFVEKTPQFLSWKKRKLAEATTLKSQPPAAK